MRGYQTLATTLAQPFLSFPPSVRADHCAVWAAAHSFSFLLPFLLPIFTGMLMSLSIFSQGVTVSSVYTSCSLSQCHMTPSCRRKHADKVFQKRCSQLSLPCLVGFSNFDKLCSCLIYHRHVISMCLHAIQTINNIVDPKMKNQQPRELLVLRFALIEVLFQAALKDFFVFETWATFIDLTVSIYLLGPLYFNHQTCLGWFRWIHCRSSLKQCSFARPQGGDSTGINKKLNCL